MKYSVVLPTLTKTEEHLQVLQKCVESIRANSKDYELIVIDDGSSMDIGNIGDIMITHDLNKGIAPSWNEGILKAQGEYIAIVNDDIVVREGWLDKLRVALEDDDRNMVSAPGVEGQDYGMGIIEDYLWFPGYCFLISKDTVQKIGYFNEKYVPFNYEDTDYWTRVLQSGGKLVRNYSTIITHIGGDVLHKLNYNEVSERNKRLFIEEHHFDPIPVFYEGAPHDWNK
jgi:O-antigen biosynthesis protein